MSTPMASSSTMSQEDSPVPQSGRPYDNNHHRYSGPQDPTPSVTPAQTDHPHQQRQNDSGDTTTLGDSHDATATLEEEDEEWLMACRCESGKTLVTLLSCLQHVADSPSDHHHSGGGAGGLSAAATATQATSSSRRSQKKQTIQPVTVFCTPSGFTFHVFGPAKQSEASIELQKSLFSQFQVQQDNADDQEDWRSGGEFCVNLCTVLNSLQLLGPLDNRTSVGLSYNLNDEIFKVELLQDGPQGILCTSAIPGLVAADDPEGDSLSNAFRSAPVAARMMVRSAILRELLPEWGSVAGASCASVAVSESRGLELAVLGHYGECWVQVPATGDHLVSPLELADPKKTVTRTYPLHSLLSSMKGLEIAEETCININAEGIMAIQHKTVDPTGQGCSNFVDFIMTCLEDEDADGEEEDGSQVSASQASQSTWRNWNNGQSQQHSPETATTSGTRRRRRTSPSQATAATNATGDDVEQSGSDTEGEAGSPSERQRRQSIQNRRDDSSDDDDQPSLSVAPLFGTVVRETEDIGNTTTSSSPRRRRPRRALPRPQRPGKRGRSRKGSDEGDVKASSSDSEEDEPLDITALPGSPDRGHSRQDECSSPELVYGNQM